MGAIQAAGWQQFPLGYLVVFFIALISKILASNGKHLIYETFYYRALNICVLRR